MPLRLSKLQEFLKQYGVVITPGAKHFHANKEGYRVYTLSAHNGLKSELSNIYLKAVCKHFDIDPKTLPI